MKKSLTYALLLSIFTACQTTNTSATEEKQTANTPSEEYQMVWSEEFDYTGLPDSTKWSYQIGDGCPNLCGWGNNELEYYTDQRSDNARVTDGKLIIEVHKETYKGREYSSAKLLTKNKGDWQYGKFLISAKLPTGRGSWPAIWMLPTLDRPLKWPLDGEIDIMEHVGFDQGRVHGTIHTDAYNGMIHTQLSGNIILPDAADTFHEYGVEWTPEKLVWLVDGKSYYQIDNPHLSEREWPFDKAFHLILNIAVGGHWGGEKGVDETIWPQKMEVDYVRVYQLAPTKSVAVTE